MRDWRLPTVVLVLAFLCSHALADERILNFQSEIQIHPDASVEVHETIRVRSEGLHIRHGIFRNFPTRYRGRAGENYTVGFEVVAVQRDGKPEPYSLDKRSDSVIIRMGDASTTLPAGEYTYELTYRATRELGFFDYHDELYWNVTGNGWGFVIDHATAIVTLPKPVAADALQLTGYTGRQGSRAQNLIINRVDDTRIEFVSTAPLAPYEGLTIVVGFPKGLVAPPSRAQLLAYAFADNATFVVGVAGLAVVLLYYLIAWMLVGRGLRRGTVVVRYEPPAGLSPPAMRFLQHMGYDQRVLVSGVVDLAVKGYLSIEQEGSLYSLTKLSGGRGALPPEESNLLRILFNDRNEVDVIPLESARFTAAKTTLTNDLNLSENQKLFRKHWAWIWPGILLSLATLGGMAMTLGGQNAAVGGFLCLWLSLWSLGAGSAISGTIKGFQQHSPVLPALIFGTVILTGIEIVVLAVFGHVVGMLPAFTLVGLLTLNIVFVHLIRAFTPEGRKLMDEIEGFKQFLTMVDGDRLERADAPAKTPALFEKYLPYALALGVEQAWSRQFEGVLAQAATVAGSGTGTVYAPMWFSSNSGGFDSAMFAGSFGSSFGSAVSSASSPPGSSSGGGGGGSSGGGGGGGGGGGW